MSGLLLLLLLLLTYMQLYISAVANHKRLTS